VSFNVHTLNLNVHCSEQHNDSLCTTPEFILRVRDNLLKLTGYFT